MSVYTPVTLAQVQQFAQQYGLAISQITPIQGGIENTNYFVHATTGAVYVLTLFELIDADTAAALVPILQRLDQAGVPVAVPLTALDGSSIGQLLDKPAQLAPRLAGEHPHHTRTAQAEAIGAALARLHLAMHDYPVTASQQPDEAGMIHAAAAKMRPDDQALLQQVWHAYQATLQLHPDRPRGLIHADLFRDNSLFVGDQLSGVLDFSAMQEDDWLMDIAVTMNDFCSDWPRVTLNQPLAAALLQGYQQVRPLTADEQACLPIALAMAAARYWLLRLDVAQQNSAQQRQSDDILQKDPLEMRAMLVDRLQRMEKRTENCERSYRAV